MLKSCLPSRYLNVSFAAFRSIRNLGRVFVVREQSIHSKLFYEESRPELRG